MKIGILDIQGSVEEHVAAAERLAAEGLAAEGKRVQAEESNAGSAMPNNLPLFSVVRVKTTADLNGVSHLILPGGESTTIGKILKLTGLDEAIKMAAREGMAVWGTCAGAILMSGDDNGFESAVSESVSKRNSVTGDKTGDDYAAGAKNPEANPGGDQNSVTGDKTGDAQNSITGDNSPCRLGLLNIDIERNAYGRQIDSFETVVDFCAGGAPTSNGNQIANENPNASENLSPVINPNAAENLPASAHIPKKIPAVFIRAPKIKNAGDCEILARHGDDIIAARKGRFLVTTFHPEMTDDLTVLKYFLNL